MKETMKKQEKDERVLSDEFITQIASIGVRAVQQRVQRMTEFSNGGFSKADVIAVMERQIELYRAMPFEKDPVVPTDVKLARWRLPDGSPLNAEKLDRLTNEMMADLMGEAVQAARRKVIPNK